MTGTTSRMRHATIQGMSGIVMQMQDGQEYFYDWAAKERYRLDECPVFVLGNPVAPQMVGTILAQMREATVVHLR